MGAVKLLLKARMGDETSHTVFVNLERDFAALVLKRRELYAIIGLGTEFVQEKDLALARMDYWCAQPQWYHSDDTDEGARFRSLSERDKFVDDGWTGTDWAPPSTWESARTDNERLVIEHSGFSFEAESEHTADVYRTVTLPYSLCAEVLR